MVVAAEVGPGLSLLPSSSLSFFSCALSSYPGGQFPLKFSQAQSSNERGEVFSQPQDKPIDCNLENSVNHVKYGRTCSLGQIFRSSASRAAPPCKFPFLFCSLLARQLKEKTFFVPLRGGQLRARPRGGRKGRRRRDFLLSWLPPSLLSRFLGGGGRRLDRLNKCN